MTTNKDVTWWDEVEGQVHMEAGSWYGPVHYCGYLHSVTNDGDTARLHVVADFMKPNV